MFKLWGSSPLNRREMIRAGGLSLGSLTLPMLLAKPASASSTGPKLKSFGKAKNCIILYLSGGPAQLDTFDPKPDAPDDIRGPFTTIQTSLPGVRFTELLPNAATEVTASAGAIEGRALIMGALLNGRSWQFKATCHTVFATMEYSAGQCCGVRLERRQSELWRRSGLQRGI